MALKKGGIYPFDRNVVADEKFDPELLKRFREHKTIPKQIQTLKKLSLAAVTQELSISKNPIAASSKLVLPNQEMKFDQSNDSKKAKKQKKCFDYDEESESELDISFAEFSGSAELSDEDFDTYRENFLAEIKSDDNFLEDLLPATTEEKENDKSYVNNDVDTTNTEQFEPNLNKKNLEVSDWILVRFTTKKSVKYFVGTIISINDNNIPNVKVLRKIKNSKFVSFHYPDVDDISEVKNNIMFLEKPDISRRGHITFKENFIMYRIQ
ncbi:unnamed protein product [Parnassius apollo]|uniref:(apollo) hypothetical protein n=1 Tax=Parnassius apollo TaxID=110799 RepID=A0A8S3WEG0_PARAO|nr:unnamed protein product [Parnassius apollo]